MIVGRDEDPAHLHTDGPPRLSNPRQPPAGPVGYSVAAAPISDSERVWSGLWPSQPLQTLKPSELKWPGERRQVAFQSEGEGEQMQSGWFDGVALGCLGILRYASFSTAGGDAEQSQQVRSSGTSPTLPIDNDSGEATSGSRDNWKDSRDKETPFVPHRQPVPSGGRTQLSKEITKHFLCGARILNQESVIYKMNCNFVLDGGDNFNIDILNPKNACLLTAAIQPCAFSSCREAILSWSVVGQSRMIASCSPSQGPHAFPLQLQGMFGVPWGTLEFDSTGGVWSARHLGHVVMTVTGVPPKTADLQKAEVWRSLFIKIRNGYGEDIGNASFTAARGTNGGTQDLWLKVAVAPAVDLCLMFMMLVASLAVRKPLEEGRQMDN